MHSSRGALSAAGCRGSTLMGKQYSSTLKPSAETVAALRERYGQEFENWWAREFGYGFDRLTESEARYLAKIRGADADAIRDRILAARQGRSRGVDDQGVQQASASSEPGATGENRLDDDVQFSLAATIPGTSDRESRAFKMGAPHSRRVTRTHRPIIASCRKRGCA